MAEETRTMTLKELVRKTALQVQKINEFVTTSQIFSNSTHELMNKTSRQCEEDQERMEAIHKNSEQSIADLRKESDQQFENLTELILGRSPSEIRPEIARSESLVRGEPDRTARGILGSPPRTRHQEGAEKSTTTLDLNSESIGVQEEMEDVYNVFDEMPRENFWANLGADQNDSVCVNPNFQKKDRNTLGKPPEESNQESCRDWSRICEIIRSPLKKLSKGNELSLKLDFRTPNVFYFTEILDSDVENTEMSELMGNSSDLGMDTTRKILVSPLRNNSAYEVFVEMLDRGLSLGNAFCSYTDVVEWYYPCLVMLDGDLILVFKLNGGRVTFDPGGVFALYATGSSLKLSREYVHVRSLDILKGDFRSPYWRHIQVASCS